jgi:hypothetical protein
MAAIGQDLMAADTLTGSCGQVAIDELLKRRMNPPPGFERLWLRVGVWMAGVV